MNASSAGRFDRTEHVLVIGLGRSGRTSVEVLSARVGSIAVTVVCRLVWSSLAVRTSLPT